MPGSCGSCRSWCRWCRPPGRSARRRSATAPRAEAFAAAARERAGAWDDPSAPVEAGAVAEFGERVAAAARPIDDVRGSAAYRRHACAVLARRALWWALADRRDEAVGG